MTHMDNPSGGGRPAPPPPAQPQARDGRRRTAGAVDTGVAQQIDENLKRLYRQQVAQELPPELQALVARLRETAGGDSSDNGGGGRT